MDLLMLLIGLLVPLQVFGLFIPQIDPVVPSFAQCRWNDEVYQARSKFNPKIYSRGRQYELLCTVCTCLETTLVQCEKVTCPPVNCAAPLVRVRGECCDICIEITPPPLVPVPTSNCVVDGVVYSDGDVFHPNNVSNATNPNPFCMSCRCRNGNVTCMDVSSSCPALSCQASEAFTPNNSCCLQCPTNSGVCMDSSTGQIYQNGAWWHPSYEGKQLTCLNCTCNNGKPKCIRLPCPPVPVCTEEQESTIHAVLCCPLCRVNTTRPVTTVPSVTTVPPTSTVPVPSLQPACDDKYTHKVYQCPDNNTVALENTTSGIVQIFSWLPGGVKRFTKQTSASFRSHPCYAEIPTGLAKEQRVRGLSTRADKKMRIDSCTRDCAQLVVTMLRILATSTDNPNPNCSS